MMVQLLLAKNFIILLRGQLLHYLALDLYNPIGINFVPHLGYLRKTAA